MNTTLILLVAIGDCRGSMATARREVSRKVPVFTGSEDALECFMFLQKASLFVQPHIGKDTEEKQLTELLLHMEGQAESWISDLLQTGGDPTKKWGAFKKQFLSFWLPHVTSKDRLRIRRSLKMKNEESPMLFYSRVKTTLVFMDNIRFTEEQRNQEAHKKVVACDIFDCFIEGCSPALAAKILDDRAVKDDDPNSLLEAIKVHRITSAGPSGSSSGVRVKSEPTVEEVIQDDEEETSVEEVRGAFARGGLRSRGRGQGGGRGRAIRRKTCFICESEQHFSPQCPQNPWPGTTVRRGARGRGMRGQGQAVQQVMEVGSSLSGEIPKIGQERAEELYMKFLERKFESAECEYELLRKGSSQDLCAFLPFVMTCTLFSIISTTVANAKLFAEKFNATTIRRPHLAVRPVTSSILPAISVDCLVDSGSDLNVLRRDVYDAWGRSVRLRHC